MKTTRIPTKINTATKTTRITRKQSMLKVKATSNNNKSETNNKQRR